VRLSIDTEKRELVCECDGDSISVPLYSKRAFEIVSDLWLKVGWNEKYTYTFSWMGRPIIQLPDDMIRTQEVIYRVRPDVIVETGVAHGGALVFYASLCKAMGRGRVVGVDIEIRPHNRAAIEHHELSSYITLIEGDSVATGTVDRVRGLIGRDERVLVLLDSCHTSAHVAAELEAYAPFVSSGSYIVATDGCMRDVCDTPRGKAEWASDNPAAAAEKFVARHREFAIEQPAWPFNESGLTENVTHWPVAWLRRT
jgi:cephalosporin hydroxylase